jgi:hypothetical protein
MSCYIDDILTLITFLMEETHNFLCNLYKLLNLNLILNKLTNNITVYLDIQLYTPQINSKPLSFSFY